MTFDGRRWEGFYNRIRLPSVQQQESTTGQEREATGETKRVASKTYTIQILVMS